MVNMSIERLTCLVLGAILGFSGVIAYFYEETKYFLFVPYTVYPYRDFAIPLVIIGCIFLVGATILEFLEKQKTFK